MQAQERGCSERTPLGRSGAVLRSLLWTLAPHRPRPCTPSIATRPLRPSWSRDRHTRDVCMRFQRERCSEVVSYPAVMTREDGILTHNVHASEQTHDCMLPVHIKSGSCMLGGHQGHLFMTHPSPMKPPHSHAYRCSHRFRRLRKCISFRELK